MENNKNYTLKSIIEKLSKSDTDMIELFGITIALLYSKELFKRNQDLTSILKRVFNVDYLPYVMRSRTLIAARITKELTIKNELELENIKKSLLQYLHEQSSVEPTVSSSPDMNKKPRKKKDANEKMKTWLEGL